MNFDLKKPCNGCPFKRTALKGWLGKQRSMEIANALHEGRTFACHKTTGIVETDNGDEDTVHTKKTQHCAGALIMIEKMGVPHQMMQVAERLGLYDPESLKMDSDVLDSTDEFVELHTYERR